VIDPAVPAAPTAAFPRSARVRARREFTEVFEGGRRVAHPLLSLHWHADARAARLGLAVSRKVDPHAVGRNRIKRILRDEFRHLRGGLASGAYVVVARSSATTADGAQLRDAFRGLLLRSGALPAPGTPGTMPPAGP
jgi:ribonuclease P protein component